jgi:pilus assembly protein CpaC
MKSHAASGAPRPLSPARATALVLALMISAPLAHAQVLQGTSARSEASAAATVASTVEARPSEIQLLVGRSTVLNMGQPITRVSLTSPDVADAMVTSHHQLLVHGKAPGTITMFVWDRAGGIRRYEVVVQRDLSQLVHQMQQLFPGEPISVTGNGEHIVIAGTVSSKYVVDKAAEVAAGYVKKAEDVVNLLKQQEGLASQQVMLRVRFAEVSRSAMTELGSSFVANGFKDGRWFARTATGGVPAPEWDKDGKLVFSDFLNLFLFDSKNQIAGVVRALQNKGLFQSLAEPNLIAENGKEASFLAGGEYPYPVVQGTGGGTSVTIQFKEFGVRLNFTPTIVGDDLIKLKVNPEVSSLDFANTVVVEGFRVPALTTRRTSTEVELQDGQTFAIAGLMNNTLTTQMSKIPGIGDIPILGLLFRSKAAQKNQTELVVMITPQILRRNSTGVSEGLPSLVEPYLGAPDKTRPNPEPYVGSPRYPANLDSRGRSLENGAVVESAPRPVPATPVAQPAERAQAEQPAPAEPLKPAKLTKEQKQALERARKEENERRKTEAKAAAEQAERDRKAAAQQAEQDRRAAAEARKQQQRMAREQAKLEKELAERRAEAEKRQAEEDKRRAAEVAAAERRLKAAQAEYQAALGSEEK